MNTLRIDTSNNLKTLVVLEKEGQDLKLEEERRAPGDQNVLKLIDRILKGQDLKLEEIKAIEINTGPGSFTGLRVGAAIANALAFGISVSVNGKPVGEVVEPEY
ncbi:MAG: tRNA threonylcarbamoyladenosine biosynthesis protein TsaB [Candidatus Levyibacteriota bacterium]